MIRDFLFLTIEHFVMFIIEDLSPTKKYKLHYSLGVLELGLVLSD